MKFDEIIKLNVNDKTEKKNGLTYLSWAWAWGEFKKIYPNANYEIVKFDGKPYYSDNSGAMVYTKVTADGLTYEMWLPVMDNRNKALKPDQLTMFDVNKTIMRCLVKNLAMFGLGLYIYAGEDLPEDENGTPQAKSEVMPNPRDVFPKTIEEDLATQKITKQNLDTLMAIVKQKAKDEVAFRKWVKEQYGVEVENITRNQFAEILAMFGSKK